MEIIIEDKEFINELERLQDEVQVRQSIISYMISSNKDINSDNFKNYQKEYHKYFKAYNQKKQEVEPKFIRPVISNAKSWSLDFKTGVLTIT